MAFLRFGRTARIRKIATASAAAETEVLTNGEVAAVSETGEIRVGDGTTAFINLPSSRNRLIRSVSANYTVTRYDDVVIVSSGSPTITLPSATLNSGRIYTVKNAGAGSVTVAGGGTNIDGAANSSALAQYALLRVISNGTQWYTI